jgi:tripartite-type tricarboxylate transporter receptor subunit TctC
MAVSLKAARRRVFITQAAALGCAPLVGALSSPAHAQSAYPAKPIRIVTPYPPGGPTEILSRLIGSKLQDRIGQPLVIESRAGAGGNVGTDYVAKSPADGYTILMGASGPLAINVTLYRHLPYDPLRDLSPIILVAAVPLVLTVNAEFPAHTVRELIDLLRAKPDAYSYASAGNGSPQHLSGELFKMETGTQIVHVPYKGSGPAINDLIAGQVPIIFDSMISILPQIRGGRVRALAVTSQKRSSLLPDVPTLAESGVPGYESIAWYGILGPGGTPPEIVGKLNREIGAVLDLPDMRARLEEMGTPPVQGSVEDFRRFMSSEILKWGKVVKASGATVD